MSQGYWICGSCRNIWPQKSSGESVRYVNCPNCGKNGDRDACIYYRSSYGEAQQLARR
jgi:hypothetical protein